MVAMPAGVAANGSVVVSRTAGVVVVDVVNVVVLVDVVLVLVDVLVLVLVDVDVDVLQSHRTTTV